MLFFWRFKVYFTLTSLCKILWTLSFIKARYIVPKRARAVIMMEIVGSRVIGYMPGGGVAKYGRETMMMISIRPMTPSV